MAQSRPAVLLDVLEEHFEELDFLWEQREAVVFAPDWNLSDLAELEERAEAHLDGLRLGAPQTVEMARLLLGGEERGAATAAAFVMMSAGSADLATEVVSALAKAEPEARHGIRIALRHCDISGVVTLLTQAATSSEPPIRLVVADLLAFHRLPPPRMADLVGAAEPADRCLFHTAAGRFGGPWSMDLLERALTAESPAVRRTALEASARIGLPGIATACRSAATPPPSPVPEAVAFLGVLGDSKDRALLESLAGGREGPVVAQAALNGLGSLGDVNAVPVLLQAMTDAKLAQAAGAAFVRITAARSIKAEAPPPPPEGTPEDEALFLDDTKPPDPERARAWWEANKGRFAPEGRWQAAEEVSHNPLGEVFRSLPLAIRRDLYLRARARDVLKTPDLELERRARLQPGAR